MLVISTKRIRAPTPPSLLNIRDMFIFRKNIIIDMNSKILLILGIAALVLLSGCPQQPSEVVVMYVCTDGTVVADKAQCPEPEGAEACEPQQMTPESESEICLGMPFTQAASYENMCLIGLAGKHKDASLCNRVSQDQRVSCYALVAEMKNNPDVCSEAEFLEDRCYEQYARDKKDASACDKISDIYSKSNCYSNLASELGDPTLCDKILNINQKDNCYLTIALRLGDSSYCNKITNSEQKQNCLQSIQGAVPK